MRRKKSPRDARVHGFVGGMRRVNEVVNEERRKVGNEERQAGIYSEEKEDTVLVEQPGKKARKGKVVPPGRSGRSRARKER
jgi:hypothetical protein